MCDRSITERAFRAYFRTAGPYFDQPSGYPFSGVESSDNGRKYVVLRGGRNETGICAVYRLRGDERLKRLMRFPRDLDWMTPPRS